MAALLRSLTAPRPEARMVDGTLVVSLPDADDPAVWRLGPDRLDGAALRLRPEEAGAWQLGLDRGEDGFAPLARYRKEADATQALTVISKALMRRGGDAEISGSALRLPRFGRAGWAVTILVGLVFGIWLLGASLPPEGGADSAGSQQAAEPAEPPVGVPMDADSFFGGR